MGMFDNVRLEESLIPFGIPGEVRNRLRDGGFQTKDLDNSLSLHFISQYGIEKSYRDYDTHALIVTKVPLEKIPSSIHFYDSVEHDWWEFKAEFKNGGFVITMVSPDPIPYLFGIGRHR